MPKPPMPASRIVAVKMPDPAHSSRVMHIDAGFGSVEETAHCSAGTGSETGKADGFPCGIWALCEAAAARPVLALDSD